MKKLFLLLSLCCISFAAWADEYTDEKGVTWEYNLNTQWDETTQTNVVTDAVITKCSNYGTEIVVPESIQVDENSYNVVSLDGSVFNDGSDQQGTVTSVTLPSTLKRIGWNVFNSFSSLKSLNIPEGVTSIGGDIFWDCNNLVLTLPSSLQSVESGAFSYCNTVIVPFTDPASLGNNILRDNVFNNVKHIAVPDEAIDTYKSAWTKYAENICGHSEIVEYTYTDNIGVTWTYNYVLSTSSARIVKAEGYSTDIVVPGTLPYNDQQIPVTAIGQSFSGNKSITTVDLSATKMTEIKSNIFDRCSKLGTIAFPTTLESIGESAFYDCYALTSIEIPASVKTIGMEAFHYCYALKDINLSNVEVIKEGAFRDANNLSSIDLSSATSVGYQAFSSNEGDEILFTINNENPATIESGAFPESAMFLVPGDAATTYKSADVWSDYASRIFGRNVAIQTINVTAQEKGSGVLEAIGGNENQTNIIDLTVKGTINGYDFVMFKDKMPNLRFLDLTDAEIVYNPYCYYEQHHSQNDTLGAYAFHQENKLLSIKLPKDIKYIGEYAFSECGRLTEINLPNTITAIGESAFWGTGLTKIILPNQLERIGVSAFSYTQLKEIAFPTTLTTIEWGAFETCGQLETVRIPSSLQYISNCAFADCSNLKNVYTYTIEPTDINENTFSNFETVQLYVPTASGQNYYWNEGWKRFVNVAEFDEEYEYFYLNGDHTLDESTGAVDGKPDADLNAGSGLTVEEGVEQNMGDLNIHHNGTNGGSIIAGSEDGNIHADNLHVNINVESGRWYFFCFPFDLKKENISMGKENTQYIFRWYDGEERAKGKSGWKNVTESEGSYLKAATGYIFQCSQSDVLTISLADVKFKKEKKYNELVASAAENLQDASWNFVGNPYLSYYDMNSVSYDAPITVWNGETYEAIKPGDDDYHFAPFEAFFVQKPEGTDSIEFDGDAQTTYNGAQAQQQETGARSIRRTDGYRKLVNIILSNGEKSDRTRIVFNDKVSMEYELACDAAKFEAAGVPQLYTIDSRAVKYAINERPVAEGIVTLGYTVPTEGIYTLDAPRMDTQVSVRDNLTRTIHRFDEGCYEFYSEAGTFEGRFTILTNSGATGIENVELDEQHEEIYNLNGQRVNKVTGKGIYIKNNRKEVNM